MKKTIVTIFAAGLVFEALAASMKDSLQPYVDSGELPGAISVLYDNGRQEVLSSAQDIVTLASRVSASGGGTVELADGTYHFYSNSATNMRFNVSNHDQPDVRPVFLPFICVTNVAVVAKNGEEKVSVKSKGFENTDVIHLDELDGFKKGVSCSRSLIAGMLARLSADGYNIGGFNAYTTSDVIRGSGLSSSAAFEVLIGAIISGLFNGGSLDPVYIAVAAQYAENVYFGKPCGLMDQTACSVGGFIGIDFGDPAEPKVGRIDFDFASCGHALCVVDTGGSHANLTDEYAAIPAEMKSVAEYFGKSVLREVGEDEFLAAIPALREKAGDRAILRAIHYFNENRRVDAQRSALENGDFAEFLRLLGESGR